MKTVLVALADGFEEIEAFTAVDVLRRAGVDVTMASVSSARLASGAHGITVMTDTLLESITDRQFDVIVLPGGLPGAEFLRDSETLLGMLRQQDARQAWIAAICASPYMVLEHHHFLKGRRATAYPGVIEKFVEATAVKENVVIDGHFITSRAPGTAMAFAIAIVRALLGDQPAEEVAKGLRFTAPEFPHLSTPTS